MTGGDPKRDMDDMGKKTEAVKFLMENWNAASVTYSLKHFRGHKSGFKYLDLVAQMGKPRTLTTIKAGNTSSSSEILVFSMSSLCIHEQNPSAFTFFRYKDGGLQARWRK